MLVSLNGRPREVSTGYTVEQLLVAMELDPRLVVVERNGEPLERKRYGEIEVVEGDRLELVRAVAGG